MIELKGMTWDHDRGYLPMKRASEVFAKSHLEVVIKWDKRSLQAFGDRPLELMAKDYDLIVIDHPHIGQASELKCIIPFDGMGYDEELKNLQRYSVGKSYESYHYNGRQWGLPIDCAALVSCYRPDLLHKIPTSWEEVIELSENKKVLCPLKPIDALSCFASLCANMDAPIAHNNTYSDCGDEVKLFDKSVAIQALEYLRAMSKHLPDRCFEYNPIYTLEELSSKDSKYHYCPFLFGYNNYARYGSRPHKIYFCDIPMIGTDTPKGAMLGGTGLSISAQCKEQKIALEFAFMVAGEEFQKGEYYRSGGQPAHLLAWLDSKNNMDCNYFFKNTLSTLKHSWLRPRYAGYLYFADIAGKTLTNCLKDEISIDSCLSIMQQSYEKSLKGHIDYKHE